MSAVIDKAPPVSPRVTLLVAALVVVLFERVVPFGGLATYPFTLLATWVHEMGHGLGALATGQRFERLMVFADASGMAFTASRPGWPSAVSAASGLLAPPLAGLSLLALGRGPRRARAALLALALALVVSLAIWVRSVAGWVALPLVAVAVAAVGAWGSERERMGSAQFLGIVLGLDTLSRMDYVFAKTATVAGREGPSDVETIARSVGGTYWLWGLPIACASLLLLALGLVIAWRAPSPRPASPRGTVAAMN